MFQLSSKFNPAGDQPQAIENLSQGLKKYQEQTLLGVTGSGKTFTMANVIAKANTPTLVLSHNKSLAAQLYEEFKTFFPNNHVCFFVSYYDYYQPESYIVQTDTYIEKDVKINEKLDQYRMETMSSLLSYDDVVVVSSVSCIYNLGDPTAYKKAILILKVGQLFSRQEVISGLVDLRFERNDTDLKAGKFRVRGNTIDLIQGYGKNIFRIVFSGSKIAKLQILHPLNATVLEEVSEVTVFAPTPFIFDKNSLKKSLSLIRHDLKEAVKTLPALEAHRLTSRTNYDLEMIEQLGYCKGIENYSRYFDGRGIGAPPKCLLDYFPSDFLMFIDESHVTLPQVRGMYEGDKTRKKNLIGNGFRLPSAYDNRPLKFEEFQKYLNKVIYVSATPGDYEMERSGQVAEQIIRPTGLIDPGIEVRPTLGQMDDLIKEIKEVVAQNNRILVTTLTKRMAEELTNYLIEHEIKAHYLHSEIDTLERIEIIRDLRLGKFDVLVGINLLREGLDLPEVALVAILDADKEGFLRTSRSLIQTIGRAARNVDSKVIMYADRKSASMKEAIKETNRRRALQIAYNKEHNITPVSISKQVAETVQDKQSKKKGRVYDKKAQMIKLETEMMQAAERLDFEKAIELREQLKGLRQ